MHLFRLKAVTAFTGAVIVSLTACGGGGGGGSATPATTTITVSPSLGKFSAGALVTLKSLGGQTLGTQSTTSAGTASVNIGTYTGPLVVEVTGGSAVTYFDEKTSTSKPFDSTQVLRAISPSVQASLGVTPATNAAVEAIKVANSGTIPTVIASSDITLANTKIATALGITNILQAPKLVDATTPKLDIANVDDRYALQLAALANLATGTNTALDVSKDLASDLSDGLLDGKFTPTGGGTAVPNTATNYTNTNIATTLSTNLVTAANTFATDDSKNIITSDPTVLGSVDTDVNDVTTVSATASTAIQQAKAMFSELRTTFSTLLNTGGTGFLNNQAKRISTDLAATATPAADKVFSRMEVVFRALKVQDAAQSGVGAGVYQGVTNIAGEQSGDAWISLDGSPLNAWNGTGRFQYCYALKPITATSVVTCFAAGRDSAGPATGTVGASIDTTIYYYSIDLLRIVLTPTSIANQFTYVATRENRNFNPSTGEVGAVNAGVAPVSCEGNCTGTVAKTLTGSTVTGFNITGTLPPSTALTGKDTVALALAKSTLSSLTNRYALSGSIATTDRRGQYPISFSLDSGSHIDIDETNSATTGSKPVAISLNGTIQTSATKFTGGISMSSFTTDLRGASTIPASMVFTGTAADLTANGAGTFLTGKFESTTSGYGSYDSTAPQLVGNFVRGTVTFTGTIQAPTRPELKLVLSGTTTGPGAATLTATYSYGTVRITGTGSDTGSTTTTSSNLVISNQDGLQIAVDPSAPSNRLITKSGTPVANITSGRVNYVDGTSESLQ